MYKHDYKEDLLNGVICKTPNTLGGAYAENRGRRGDALREDNPFENGPVKNWNHRQGWDQYFDHGGRHGGKLIRNTDNHYGKGPRGYQRPDESIYEDVCETLRLSPDIDASGIEVVVKSGVVTLKGNLSDRNIKRMMELEIENVSGVKDVQNLITIGEV